jgi:hypothetical protein
LTEAVLVEASAGNTKVVSVHSAAAEFDALPIVSDRRFIDIEPKGRNRYWMRRVLILFTAAIRTHNERATRYECHALLALLFPAGATSLPIVGQFG